MGKRALIALAQWKTTGDYIKNNPRQETPHMWLTAKITDYEIQLYLWECSYLKVISFNMDVVCSHKENAGT